MKGIEKINQIQDSSFRLPPELKRYKSFMHELEEDNEIILRNSHRLPPKSFRQIILKAYHIAHPRQTVVKQNIRQFYWWSGVNNDITKHCMQCITCTRTTKVGQNQRIVRRPMPTTGPWTEIAIDFLQAGEVKFLVIVDTHSRYLFDAKYRRQSRHRETESVDKRLLFVKKIGDKRSEE